MADWRKYRESAPEKERVDKIFSLIDDRGGVAIDIGAHDDFMASILAEKYDTVIALDITRPQTESNPDILPIIGDACSLPFADNSFDLVLCTEVLEHIRPDLLPSACSEIARITGEYAVIGVPFKQDIRVSRTTCRTCGRINPPWGHQNSFDEKRLRRLFDGLVWEKEVFAGEDALATNALSAKLLDLAGNPYGIYDKDLTCIYCGNRMMTPPDRSFVQKVLTRIAAFIHGIQRRFTKVHPSWIHIRFRKARTDRR